jgi:hypothetical protein
MSTTQGSQKCSNKPYQTSTGYVECINEDLPASMKYTTGISQSISIGAIVGIVAVLVVLILIFLSIKAKVNPFDLIMSFFR